MVLIRRKEKNSMGVDRPYQNCLVSVVVGDMCKQEHNNFYYFFSENKTQIE